MDFFNSLLYPFTYLKGVASKFLWIGGGLTTLSLGSAALRKPEVVIEKGQELGVYAFNGAAGVVNAIFTNTQRVVSDVTTSVGTGASTVWNYFFGGSDDIIKKPLPAIKQPDTPSYSWWDTITAPRRWVGDSFNTYQDWAPVKFDLHLLQGRGGRLVGESSEVSESRNMISETLRLLGENIYKKDYMVENLISKNVDNNIYVSKWIAKGFQAGIDHINLLYERQAQLDAQIQSLALMAAIVAIFIFVFSLLQGSAPLWRQVVMHNIELTVNSYQERKRLKMIAFEERLNKNNPYWNKQSMMLRYPAIKPFQLKLREDHEYEKPLGLRGFWGNVASAINVFRMWRKSSLKIALTWILTKLLCNVFSYMNVTHSILQKKVSLLVEVLQSLNIQVTAKHDQASLIYLLNMLLEKSQKTAFIDFYVHNAPHHKILFGFLVMWGGLIFNRACADLLVLGGNSLRDFILHSFTPPTPPAPPAGSVSAATATGGKTGTEAGAEAGEQTARSEANLMRLFEEHRASQKTQTIYESAIPSPAGSPSQTLLNTRLENFAEPERRIWDAIRTPVQDVLHFTSRLAEPGVLLDDMVRNRTARQIVENSSLLADSVDLVNTISP